jgi:hypothetical protein
MALNSNFDTTNSREISIFMLLSQVPVKMGYTWESEREKGQKKKKIRGREG